MFKMRCNSEMCGLLTRESITALAKLQRTRLDIVC